MNREQLRFLFFGILFGFVIGYLVAFGVHDTGVVQRAAPVPAAGNMGMAAGGASPPGGAMDGESLMARVTEEIGSLKAVIEKEPRNQRALVRLANLYHDAGMFDPAVEYYGRALEVDPTDVNARTDMGICLYQLQRVDEAIAEFRASLSHDPQHWQTWLNLGLVSLREKADLETAAEAFSRLEEINPSYEGISVLKEALEKARRSAGKASS